MRVDGLSPSIFNLEFLGFCEIHSGDFLPDSEVDRSDGQVKG